jgi:uncharacterized protein YraI
VLCAACLAALPATASADWRNHISAEIPYRVSATAGHVNVRAGPGTSHRVTARLRAGTTGLWIKNCLNDASWCLVAFGGRGATGWVRMKYLAGYAD